MGQGLGLGLGLGLGFGLGLGLGLGLGTVCRKSKVALLPLHRARARCHRPCGCSLSPSPRCSTASCCRLGRSCRGWVPLHLHRQRLQQKLQQKRRPPRRTGERWPLQASSLAALASLWRRRWALPRRSGGTSLLWATATTVAWARRSAARSRLPYSRRSCAPLRCERGKLPSEGPLCPRAVRGITHPPSQLGAARAPTHRATAPPRHHARRPLTRCASAAPEP